MKVDFPSRQAASVRATQVALGFVVLACLAGCRQVLLPASDFQSEATLASPKATAAAGSTAALAAPPPASFAETTTETLQFKQSMPARVVAAATFTAALELVPGSSLTNVVVRSTIPDGATYQRSDPPATVADDALVWKLGVLETAQSLQLKAWFKADSDVTPVSSTTITATPEVLVRLTVGQALLALDSTGPAVAQLNSNLTYHTRLRNIGSETVRNIQVRQTAPPGLTFNNQTHDHTLEAGELAPGQSVFFTTMLAATRRGRICMTNTVTSANAPVIHTEVCTTVIDPHLQVQAAGAKEQVVGRNVDYEITATNTGDVALTNVVIQTVAPETGFIVAAPGAVITGQQAAWTIPTLPPRGQTTRTVKLTSKTAGVSCATITASAGVVADTIRLCTLWKGVPALTFRLSEDPDPIQVGESTTYRIVLINQGSGELHNVKVNAVFDDLMLPLGSPQGTIHGQRVAFPTIATIKARQSVTYTITAKGAVVGDSHNRVEVSCDELKGTIEREESTTIY
ncbi:MAG TPA: hypothetical protein PKO21_14690 [Verrucomicrobiota bacterium]|nr:hypothetical protein [Verrucomicrobiota bacterium]